MSVCPRPPAACSTTRSVSVEHMQTPVADYLEEVLIACAGFEQGALADYIPELALADPDRLAMALCTPDGKVYVAGADAEHQFTIQSISKPFTYALALRDRGLHSVLSAVDVEPSGNAFNDISLDSRGRPKNPMINIGALTTFSLVGEEHLDGNDRAEVLRAGLSEFAGRELAVDEAVYASELEHGWRNLALAALVKASDKLVGEPRDAMIGYTRGCSILVDTVDLAVMAMTLASGGTNPVTGKRVIPAWVARQVMSVMSTCGMYDAAGDWMSRVGIPAKSGVSGGIMGTLPGQVGLASYSPRIDRFGNSVRGVEIYHHLSDRMGMHIMNTPAPSIDAVGQRSTTPEGRRLVALQGQLNFANAELALRHFEEIPPGIDDVVVDFTLVPAISDVGARMIREGLRRLSLDGHDIILVDPHGRMVGPERTDDEVAARVVDRRAEI